MHPTMLNRREMLKSAALAAGASLLAPLQACKQQAGQSNVFRIGACDWSLGRSGPDALRFAAEIGLDGVQLSFDEPGGESDLRTEAARTACATAAREKKVAIASLAMGALNGEPLATSAKAEGWVGECIDVMKAMGQKVVLLAFFGDGDVRDVARQDTLIAVLKRLAPKAEQAGVVLGIESQLDAAAHLRVIDAVGSAAVKVYYDPCNVQSLGYPLYDDLRTLATRKVLCEVHTKEDDALLGKGKVEFARVRDILVKHGYAGWLIIEGAVPNDMKVEEAYKANASYLRSLFNAKKPA